MSESKGIAIVTGAAQGLGRAIALRLASDGFDMALNDLPKQTEKLTALQNEIKEKGRKTFIVTADVTDAEQVKTMIDEVVKELGGLDVMIANAGIAIYKPFVDMTTDDWNRILSINIRGTANCYQYAGLQMIKQGRGGRIVGASSMGGKLGWPLLSAYCATKWAVRGLTATVAKELGPYNITVNAYAPSGMATDMLWSLDKWHNELGLPGGSDAVSGSISSTTALGRNGEPEDVAGYVSYLVSKDGGFITGQSVSINGGAFSD